MSETYGIYRSLQPLIGRMADSPLNTSLNRYLRSAGWEKQPSGPSGSLWYSSSKSGNQAVLAVPEPIMPTMREWPGVLQRLAAFEQRPSSDIALAVLTQYVDVKRLRAASETVISETIPLDVGLNLVRSAHTMLRAAGTTSRRPRARISGNYSERGDEVAHEARMAHTEDGSYVVPVWVPLTPAGDENDLFSEAPDAERYPHEPPERRVTRTLAQSLEAVQKIIVQPASAIRNASELMPLIAAGGSRELLLILHNILRQPGIDEFEAQFSWAGGVRPPGGIGDHVIFDADAAPLLESAARLLKGPQQFPSEIYTGMIIILSYRPGDPDGEIGIDTVRKGHGCEIRVRLDSETMHRTYEWAQNERAVLVEGTVRRGGPGNKLRIDSPARIHPLDEATLW